MKLDSIKFRGFGLSISFKKNFIFRLFNKVPIFAKLVISFLILNSFIIGIGYFSSREIENTAKYIEAVYEKPLQSVNFSKSAHQNFLVLDFEFYKIFTMGNYTAESSQNIDEILETFQSDLEISADRAIGEYSAETIDELSGLVAKWVSLKDKIYSPTMEKAFLYSALTLISEQIKTSLSDLSEFETGAAYDFVIAANAKAKSIKERNLQISIIAALICIIIAIILSINLLNPIKQCLFVASQISEGHLKGVINVQRSDEFGKLLNMLKCMQQNLIRNIESQKVALHQTQEVEQGKKQALLGDISLGMENMLQDGLDVVKEALSSLDDTSEALALSAQSSTVQIELTSENMVVLDQNMVGISKATDALSHSIFNISSKTVESDEITEQTVLKANTATNAIEKLNATSNEVGNVLELIEEITSRINLLALNATIEAARAGEAGKGFSVVASEVKDLANQTSNATDQIQQQITRLQEASQYVENSIDDIVVSVSETQEISASIADLVNHQKAATSEIVDMVQNVSVTTQETSLSVKKVTKSLSGTSRSSGDVRGATVSLAEQMSSLQSSISQSILAIKTA